MWIGILVQDVFPLPTTHRPIGFELLPEKFTIPQLQSLYEAIHQTKLDDRNFRKKLLSFDLLIKLNEKDKSTSKKGAFLYRFNYDKYKKLEESGPVVLCLNAN